MRLLLDTNVFLRYFLAPTKIKPDVRLLLESAEAEVCVSAVTPWEIAIKVGSGKLRFPHAIGEYIALRMERAGFVELPVLFRHTFAVRDLPAIHRDPFDRLLVAQAQAEDLTLVTADRMLLAYPVDTIQA